MNLGKIYDKAARMHAGQRNPLSECESVALAEMIQKESRRNDPARRVRRWLATTGRLPPEMRRDDDGRREVGE